MRTAPEHRKEAARWPARRPVPEPPGSWPSGALTGSCEPVEVSRPATVRGSERRTPIVVSGTVWFVMACDLPVAGVFRRGAAASVLGVLLLAAGACSAGDGGEGGQAGSCADLITIAGVTYMGGRGVEGTAPVPHTGTELHATVPPCQDTSPGSVVPAHPAIAYAIPGVLVADAVAGPYNEVMVAQRLWDRPWAELPPELQPYVRR
jgi:hypothetical protein